MGTVHAKEKTPPESLQKSPEEKLINLEGIRARVDRINVEGLTRTKDDIIVSTVRELFSARDFQEVVREAHRARGRLERLGCFRNIGIYIDTSRGPGATPHGFEVTFHVKELKRVIGGVNTMVGNNEGSLVLGLRAPNILGRGERLKTEYSYGSKRTSSFLVAVSKPFAARLNPIVSGSVVQQGSEWPWSGYRLLERAVLLDCSFLSAPHVKHHVQWEGAWRELSSISRGAAFQVREQSGPTLKSSVRHVLSVDRRDGAIFPTSGALAQWTTEVAGLGGNVGFLKNDLHLQCNWSPFGDFVVQAAAQAGVMTRPASGDRTVSMCDQFYLGGPLGLRGFHTRGVGPHVDGSALGSDAFWACALHLYAPLPFRPGAGGFGDLFRTHLFVNGGNVGALDLKGDVAQSAEQLCRDARLAYGVGVAMRLGQMARVELNYCFPARHRKGDETCPGVQFGVGVHFL